ncbi:uncharacterized protein [Ptychodera flava]|uniref:uncharacterized protein n=1 Tax=Ptychodera flava TaxID=63121 RepID=UPI00396A6467
MPKKKYWRKSAVKKQADGDVKTDGFDTGLGVSSNVKHPLQEGTCNKPLHNKSMYSKSMNDKSTSYNRFNSSTQCTALNTSLAVTKGNSNQCPNTFQCSTTAHSCNRANSGNSMQILPQIKRSCKSCRIHT